MTGSNTEEKYGWERIKEDNIALGQKKTTVVPCTITTTTRTTRTTPTFLRPDGFASGNKKVRGGEPATYGSEDSDAFFGVSYQYAAHTHSFPKFRTKKIFELSGIQSRLFLFSRLTVPISGLHDLFRNVTVRCQIKLGCLGTGKAKCAVASNL